MNGVAQMSKNTELPVASHIIASGAFGATFI
jgi:hypothetical protein